jgi:hypothetical protein
MRSTTPVKCSSAPTGITIGTGRLQAVDHHLHHAEEIGAGAVHFIDEGQPRNVIFIRLSPDGFRLWLHAADGVIDHHRAVEHAHGAFHLNGEIHARGVDNIDACGSKLRSMPGQKQLTAAEVMVIPRSCSCAIQSVVAAPSCTSPSLWLIPV